MRLIERLSEILDLPANYVVNEANIKLAGTYMELNGSLQWISEFSSDYVYTKLQGEVSPRAIPEVRISSFNPWMPSSGVFTSKSGEKVCLVKNPRRQWKRSFHPENYTVSGYPLSDNFSTYDFDLFAPPVEIFKSSEDFIFYHLNCIGRVHTDKITLKKSLYSRDSRFTNELIAWAKNEKILSDFPV